MKHKITLPQLKKYDITQKVIMALADAESRVILFSIIRKGKTASELSGSLKIPLSSVYKKIVRFREFNAGTSRKNYFVRKRKTLQNLSKQNQQGRNIH